MKVTHDDLWLCHDCAIVTVNGDWSGVDDGSPEGAKIRRRIEQGLGELGAIGAILEKDGAEKLLKALPKGKKACAVTCAQSLSGGASFEFDGQKMSVRNIDGQFPDFERVIVSPEKMTPETVRCAQMMIQPAYLADMGATFDAFAKVKTGSKAPLGMVLTQGPDASTPLRADAAIECGENTWEVTHVVMPLRWGALPSRKR